jgi:hypothetical protein
MVFGGMLEDRVEKCNSGHGQVSPESRYVEVVRDAR